MFAITILWNTGKFEMRSLFAVSPVAARQLAQALIGRDGIVVEAFPSVRGSR